MPISKDLSAPRFRRIVGVILGVSWAAAACSPSPSVNRPDSATVARTLADSLAKAQQQHAGELRDSARVVLATLLKDPKTAAFDSVRVVQPPAVNGRLPSMAVCGTISGKPGIGGRSAPSAFIYQNRMTVFVEDPTNHQEFGTLWTRLCADPASTVIVK